MPLKCGIVGLPNVGKSCLFNALSKANAETANFPFCTIDPNVGMVSIPDERLQRLAQLIKPGQVIPNTMEFVDIAGLVRGASKGKGKGNAFLSYIRDVDLILHIVRCFDNDDIIHVEGDIDPLRDIDIIESELLFKDLESIEKREEKWKKMAKSGDKTLQSHVERVGTLRSHVEKGQPVRSCELWNPEHPAFDQLLLLSVKKVLYVCNISENDLPDGANNPYVKQVKSFAEERSDPVMALCAKIEAEMAEIPEEDAHSYLELLGLEKSGLDRLILSAYKNLGLITFFTSNSKILKAWTLTKGSTAFDAAGIIHTDFQKGFIRAETISYEDFIQAGSEPAARTAGKMRSEGRDYPVRDGDILLFRFNI